MAQHAITDPALRANVAADISNANIARHRHGAIDDKNLNADQRLFMSTEIIRAQALRENPSLREAFQRPRVGIGRRGIDWN